MTPLPHHKLETNSIVKLTKLQEGKRAPVHAGAVLMLPSPLQAAPMLLPQEVGTPWDTVLASFSSHFKSQDSWRSSSCNLLPRGLA